MAEIAELHRRACEAFAARVEGVRDEQWALLTPCVDWDVQALVNHVVGEDRWTAPLMAGSTIAEIGDLFDGDLLGEDPKGACAAAVKEAVAAVGAPGSLQRTVHLSFGDVPGEEYAWQLFADHLIHTWDLAVAVGGDERLDPELVAGCAGWFAEREQAYRAAGAIAARPAVADDADPQTTLLAGFGRDAAWTPTLGAVQRFNAAFNTGDVDAIMAAMTDDCVFESTEPPDGRRHQGQDAVRAVWRSVLSGRPRFETEELVDAGDRAVARWIQRWTDAGGSEGHVRGLDLFRVRDGKIAEKLSYVKG
jgi:uncharacterized protein (TIGR03086 family)